MRAALGGFEEAARLVWIEEAGLLAAGFHGALALGGTESRAGGVAVQDLPFDGELQARRSTECA